MVLAAGVEAKRPIFDHDKPPSLGQNNIAAIVEAAQEVGSKTRSK